jgi:hypothetical protein
MHKYNYAQDMGENGQSPRASVMVVAKLVANKRNCTLLSLTADSRRWAVSGTKPKETQQLKSGSPPKGRRRACEAERIGGHSMRQGPRAAQAQWGTQNFVWLRFRQSAGVPGFRAIRMRWDDWKSPQHLALKTVFGPAEKRVGRCSFRRVTR